MLLANFLKDSYISKREIDDRQRSKKEQRSKQHSNSQLERQVDWREWQRVPGHYNPWIFQRRDACWGVTEKRTTPPLLFITLPSRGGLNSLSFSFSVALVSIRRSPFLPTTIRRLHHCTLFIPRNLNYTFNRTTRRLVQTTLRLQPRRR